MAHMKTKLSKPKTVPKAKSKEPKMIKPPVPSKPVKLKPRPRNTNSRTGALGATSPY